MIHLMVHLVRKIEFIQASVYALDVPIWKIVEDIKRVGCIVESYVAEKAVEFCSKYIGGVEIIGVLNTRNTSNKGIGVENLKFMGRDD